MAVKGISWSITKEDAKLSAAIAKRAVEFGAANNIQVDYVDTEMDITACHCNGCPLDLSKLLNASDADFGHDVFGIRRHLDRSTGELMDCFVPRCARQESQD